MQFEVKFPDPRLADAEGLVAAGGELGPEYLISAYVQGVFPWFNEGDPVLWWSPDPRLVLYPKDFKVSKSFRQLINSKKYELRIDKDFSGVIKNCAKIARPRQDGTWIIASMIDAYIHLHEIGIAHSFETYYGDKLVGGLYGVSLGKAFFGESMFFKERDASKFALYNLVEWCKKHDFHFIDAQTPTKHLKSLGAKEIDRDLFLNELDGALKYKTISGKWDIKPSECP